MLKKFPYLWDLFQDAVLGNHLIILCPAFKICYAEPEQCPWLLRFPDRLLRTGSISSPVWLLDTVASNPFRWSLPQLWIVSSHTCPQHRYSVESSKGILYKLLESSLLATFSSLLLCPEHSNCLASGSGSTDSFSVPRRWREGKASGVQVTLVMAEMPMVQPSIVQTRTSDAETSWQV